MKRPTFYEGVLFALFASIIGSAIFGVFSGAFGNSGLVRLLIAAGGFCYVLYLLSRSDERIGRVTVILVWLVVAGLSWILVPSLLLYVLIHAGLIWMIRSLYFHESPVGALADLALMGLGWVVALWVGMHTGSVLISVWCFFLSQALFVFIPANLFRHPLKYSLKQKDKHTQYQSSNSNHDQDFELAYRNAESALRRLSARI